MPLGELWSVITLYITQLYVLDLFIGKELQSCTTSSEKTTNNDYCDSKLVVSKKYFDDGIISSIDGETKKKIDEMDIIETKQKRFYNRETFQFVR